MSRPSTRFRSRCPLALASLAILSVAVPANAANWSPTSVGKVAKELSDGVGQGKPIRLSDRGPLAAVRTQLPVTSDATATSDVRMRSISMRRGQARALVAVSGPRGSYQGGVARPGDRRLHWAAWFSDAKGRRHDLTIGPLVAAPTSWHSLTLDTAWNRPDAKGSLSVDGTPVAATATRSLVGAMPSTAIVGLLKASRRTDRATVLVRYPLTTGQAPGLTGGPVDPANPLAPATPPSVGGTAKPPTVPGTTPPGTGTTKPPTTGTTPPPVTTNPPPTPTPVPPSAPSASGPLPGREFRRLDYESGTLSGWTSVQDQSGAVFPSPGMTRSGAGRITIVRSPVAQGTYAARFETHQGDGPFCCGDRAEVGLAGDNPESEGQERWYEWNMMLETGFPWQNTGFQTLGDFHSTSDGQPPLGIQLYGNEIRLDQVTRNAGQTFGTIHKLWSETPQVNHWYTFRMHVKWSGDPNVGLVEMWVDGKLAVPAAHWPTLVPGTTAFYKQGYYRDSSVGPTGAVLYDNFHASQVP